MIFILFKIRKKFFKIIFKLILTNKKSFSKNLIFLFLTFIKKTIIIVFNIVKIKLSTFYILISIFLI